jgi:acyl dehydratase
MKVLGTRDQSEAEKNMDDMFFDDFQVGQKFVSPNRTVTETDLSMFNMLSGDWHPVHSDEEYAKGTVFGTRILSGIFGIAIMTGLSGKFGVFDRSVLAMLSLEDWFFHKPIMVGDTLHIEMTIIEKRPTSKGDRGIIDRKYLLLNQRGEVVQEGRSKALVLRRKQSDET